MNAPSTKPETLAFAREELAGRLLAVCVGQLEKLRTPWNMTSEKNQAITLDKMRETVDKAVRDAVIVIATERRPALRATVESVTFKDEIKATLSLSKAMEGRHDLADAAGSTVLVIIAHPEAFTGGAEKVEPKPDQNALDLQSQPELHEQKDGTWSVYKDNMPIPGGTGFKTHVEAEQWLQKQFGLGKKSKDGTRDAATPEIKLEDVKYAFHQAAREEAKKEDGDWDKGWERIATQYPRDFVEENYTELSAAFADGWDEGTSDET